MAREESLTIVRLQRRWRTRQFDRPPGRAYDLNGSHVTDKAGFYLAIGEAINGPGGYFGCNLDALNDCLRGRFGARTPRLAARLGRQVVTVGALVVALGYAALAETASAMGAGRPVAWIIPGLLVAGAGMGLIMAPLPAIVLAGTDPRHAAAASGVLRPPSTGAGRRPMTLGLHRHDGAGPAW
ncbi:barstar family protein [Microbispora sp. CA-135349]|uniref:barstar family protein n=1 Tax=Microbispora sp. CA-135349 TaxID=3239953 RepID=UPI003D8CD4A1